MSGLTPLPIVRFRALLRGRGKTISALAAEVGVARNSLWRGLRGHGATDEMRKRIHALTTAQEWAELIQLEHWATWNTAQLAAEAAAQPGEYVWLRLQLCAHCGGDRRFVGCVRAQARHVTHGICPTCLRTHYPDFAEEVLAKQAKEKHAA